MKTLGGVAFLVGCLVLQWVFMSALRQPARITNWPASLVLVIAVPLALIVIGAVLYSTGEILQHLAGMKQSRPEACVITRISGAVICLIGTGFIVRHIIWASLQPAHITNWRLALVFFVALPLCLITVGTVQWATGTIIAQLHHAPTKTNSAE